MNILTRSRNTGKGIRWSSLLGVFKRRKLCSITTVIDKRSDILAHDSLEIYFHEYPVITEDEKFAMLNRALTLARGFSKKRTMDRSNIGDPKLIITSDKAFAISTKNLDEDAKSYQLDDLPKQNCAFDQIVICDNNEAVRTGTEYPLSIFSDYDDDSIKPGTSITSSVYSEHHTLTYQSSFVTGDDILINGEQEWPDQGEVLQFTRFPKITNSVRYHWSVENDLTPFEMLSSTFSSQDSFENFADEESLASSIRCFSYRDAKTA